MSDDEVKIGYVWHGRYGSIEILAEGTTERECEERGEHLFRWPAEADILLAAIREHGEADAARR